MLKIGVSIEFPQSSLATSSSQPTRIDRHLARALGTSSNFPKDEEFENWLAGIWTGSLKIKLGARPPYRNRDFKRGRKLALPNWGYSRHMYSQRRPHTWRPYSKKEPELISKTRTGDIPVSGKCLKQISGISNVVGVSEASRVKGFSDRDG